MRIWPSCFDFRLTVDIAPLKGPFGLGPSGPSLRHRPHRPEAAPRTPWRASRGRPPPAPPRPAGAGAGAGASSGDTRRCGSCRNTPPSSADAGVSAAVTAAACSASSRANGEDSDPNGDAERSSASTASYGEPSTEGRACPDRSALSGAAAARPPARAPGSARPSPGDDSRSAAATRPGRRVRGRR